MAGIVDHHRLFEGTQIMQNTLRRLICVDCLFATLIVPGLSSLRGQDALSEPARPGTSLAARVRPVVEAVMEHHIDPPTRQQLVLEILRGAAESRGQRSPGDLSPRISDAVDADALYNLLAVELERQGLNEQPSDEMIATVFERLSGVVPGGLQIVSQKDHTVNEQLAANRYVGIGVQVSLDETTHRLKIQNHHCRMHLLLLHEPRHHAASPHRAAHVPHVPIDTPAPRMGWSRPARHRLPAP